VGDTLDLPTSRDTEFALTAQQIAVEITDWAIAAGTKKPHAQHTGIENLPKNPVKRKGFWGGISKKSEAPKVAPPSRSSTLDHPPWSKYTARYAVYSAEVVISPSDDLHKGLKAMTKKDPPSHFEFEMVYVSIPAFVVVRPTLMTDAVLQRGI
jgi:hypothetical protein